MSIETLISEFAELHAELTPLQKRYDKLKKELAQHASVLDTLDEVILSNDLYSIIYSKPSQTSECKLTVQEFIQETGSYDSLSISLTAAKANLSKEQFNELFKPVQTRTRKLLEVVQLEQ
jgi:hypothetical protein